LSIANQRRQRGSEERNSDLLIELDPGDSREVDMVVASKQCDQNQQQAGSDRDPALKIKSEKNHSQNRSPELPSGGQWSSSHRHPPGPQAVRLNSPG
jgi:hypothetical protein